MLREPAATSETSNVRRGFEDGLGRRYRPAARLDSETPLEILCFRHEITDVPAFEFALRERVARLSDFHHASFARIRKVDRLNDERGTVALMADGVSGDRLSDLLTDGSGRNLDRTSALSLIQQLISAVAALHLHAKVAHGAIAPERLFVTPGGQLMIADYALGAALEQLKYSRQRYWKDLRVALPLELGASRFDERVDLAQVGIVALAVLLRRPLRDDEYPQQIESLVASVSSRTSEHDARGAKLVEWLRRSLQLEGRNSFRSAADAQAAFEEVVSSDAQPAAEPEQVPVPAVAQTTPAPKFSVTTTEAYPPEPTYEPYEPLPLPDSDSTELSEEGANAFDDQEDTMRSAHSSFQRAGRLKWIAAGVALLALTSAAVYAGRQRLAPATPPVTTGMMSVNTDPPGAEVLIDGVARGRSPISLSLAAGAHTLVVKGQGESRTVPITIAAGAEVSQYLELPKAGSGFGQLQVRSEPAGARISIDGTPVGKTPLTIVEIAPGEHLITLEGELGSVTQKVNIEAGVPASLVVPMGAPAGAVATGWVSVTAPIVVDLMENGRMLGNSGIDRIMLPAGKHDIELVNEHVGYRETRTVQVSPGRTASLSVTLPKGTVSLNAIPWANVSIDGENVGDTPIGNLSITVGPHEVVFRNAELGEQRRIITVTQRTPVRLSVDLTKK